MERITDISQLDLTKQYTYADYLTWWFDERVELIRGYIKQMAPASSNKHQEVSSHLHKLLADFLWRKSCVIRYAPFEVRLKKLEAKNEPATVVQPDICVICDTSLIDSQGCNGAPDLIIEILSVSNVKHDLVTKYKLYEEAGVKEYWIVYPYDGLIDVFHLEEESYVLFRKYADDDKIEVKTLPGLTIDLKDIFFDEI